MAITTTTHNAAGTTFDKKAGEDAFRSEMNGVLRMHDPP
jgi:hypothetical protein